MEVKIEHGISLCSWCRWGNTHDTETWCSSDKFQVIKGSNNWPNISKCDEFEIDKNVTPVDVAWFSISHAASEIDRLNLKLTLMNAENIKY
jgi:hypothetical protein